VHFLEKCFKAAAYDAVFLLILLIDSLRADLLGEFVYAVTAAEGLLPPVMAHGPVYKWDQIGQGVSKYRLESRYNR